MKIIKGKNTNTLYRKTLKYVWNNGEKVSPKGLPTREIYPVWTEVEKPLERFMTVYGRGGNPFFLCAEVIWILAGMGEIEWIRHYSKTMGLFADDGEPLFNGAYGTRIRKWGLDRDGKTEHNKPVDQLTAVFSKLKQDADTRQAVMSLWHPVIDNYRKSNDFPCNDLSMFKIRNGKLNLHQILRSNDVTFGLFPTNVFQWTVITEVLAGWMNLPVGEVCFFSDCLHAYEEDFNGEINKKMLKENREYDVYKYFEPTQDIQAYDEFHVTLSRLLENDRKYRKGNFEERKVINGSFWYNIDQMLYIYNIRKIKGEVEAVKECVDLIRKDFLISALEFIFRLSKHKDDLKILIYSLCLELTTEDLAYIFNSYGTNRVSHR